jgi:hypothetical protein
LTFQQVSTDGIPDEPWYDAESKACLRLESRSGGPGWDGASLAIHFQEQLILINASWPSPPFGQYLVGISLVKLPNKLLIERQQIEHLITEGVIAFCLSEYPKDFHLNNPIVCKINMGKTAWIGSN